MGIDGGGIRGRKIIVNKLILEPAYGMNFQSKDDEAGKGALHTEERMRRWELGNQMQAAGRKENSEQSQWSKSCYLINNYKAQLLY